MILGVSLAIFMAKQAEFFCEKTIGRRAKITFNRHVYFAPGKINVVG